MGIAHLLGLAETELTSLFDTRPPIADHRLAVLGYDETDPSAFRRGVFDTRPDLTTYADYQVRASVAASCCYQALRGGANIVDR